MGAIQPRLPEAAPYGIEMRRESFYLNSWHEAAVGVHTPRVEDMTLVVAAGDLPALHTAVLQAEAYVRDHLPRPVPGWKPGIAEWTLREDDDEVRITGPWVGTLHAGPAGDADSPHVQVWSEVTYSDLPGLVGVLTGAMRHALDGEERRRQR